ncbi:MAG: DUF192 domain-containing protein [Bacteroidota bacterium]
MPKFNQKRICPLKKILWMFMGMGGLGMLLLFPGCGSQGSKGIEEPMQEPVFSHEANLQLIKRIEPDSLIELAVELAITEVEQRQGLMYRRHMEADQGMLFIFNKPEPRSFWMRNTYIPLDILYIDENQRIVSIHENLMPLYSRQVPSFKPAQYVLEVVGGFCADHGIQVGDSFSYQPLNPS